MSDLFLVLYVVSTVWAVMDIVRKLRGTVERTLWIVCAVMVPVIGPAYWVYVQYSAPEARRIEREERRRKLERRRRR